MNNNKLNKLIESIDQYIIENNDEKINKLYKSLNNEEYEDLPILKDIINIAYNILLGDSLNYSLRTDFMKKLFLLQDLKEGDFEDNPQQYFDKVDNNIKNLQETPLNQIAVLVSGITFLNLYVQINWTGPTLEISREFTFKNDNREIRKLLEVDGETIYSKTKNPIFLYLAKICLVDNYSFLSDGCKSSCWWSCRTIMVHQKSLSNPTPTFKSILNERYQIVIRFYSISSLLNQFEEEEQDNNSMDTSNDGNSNKNEERNKKINLLKDLSTKAIIEQSLVFSYFRQLNKIKESIKNANETSELECSLTGALGRRTRFQTFDTAQLVIQINNARKRDEDGTDEEEVFDRTASIKREVTNDDPTLLVRPELKEKVEGQNKNLRNIDQCLILLQCLNVKNQNINNGLTTEEMTPYVSKTLEKSNNWLIHSMGLLIKSRLEIASSKTAERAVLQIQALIDQYDDPTSNGFERMRYVYTLDFPTRWEMEKEVAERFIGIGAAASAYDIFERLEMWDEAIKCLTFMGKNARSEELVRKRLEIEETPELYCVLGDLKGDPQFYIKGWELSKRRYSRAQRALARYYMEKLEYQKCIESFQLALAINPLFANAWFTMGCAAMRIEAWEVATNAFSRVVSLEPEEGEAWANLASVYMYQKQMDRAFSALQEGLKHKRENWKMWENYLYCCVSIKDFQNAIIAINQIFDLNNKKIDLKVCKLIVQHVINNDIDRQGIQGRKLEKIVSEMFGRITSKLTNNSELWYIYSQYHYSLGNNDKAIDLLQKACRSAETAQWEGEQSTFEKVVEFNNNLCQLYFEFPTTSNIYSAKLKIKSIIKKCEISWKETDSFKILEGLLIKLDEKEIELINKKSTN